MTLLLMSFGAFFITEFAKTVLDQFGFVLPSWGKALIALVVAVVLAVSLGGLDEETAAWAVAGAGVAGLVHKVHRWFSAAGDGHQLAAMQMAVRRR